MFPFSYQAVFCVLLCISTSFVHAQTIGCMDPEALNYNESATINSENCVYPISCPDGYEFKYFSVVGSAGESCELYLTNASFQDTLVSTTINDSIRYFSNCFHPDSCYTIHVPEDTDDNTMISWIWVYDENQTITSQITAGIPGSQYRLNFNISGDDCGTPGCTDPSALNYFPEADIDYGCEYCETNEIMVTSQMHFSPSATWSIHQEDVMMEYQTFSIDGTTESMVCLADGCYELRLSDSQDEGWAFHEIFVEHPNGDTLASGTLSHGGLATIPFGVNVSDCEDENEVYGCTNPLASNHNPNATVYNGSCILENDECDISFAFEQDSINGGVFIVPDIYATSYPIANLWNFDNPDTLINEILPSTTLNGTGPFEVCVTLYTFDFLTGAPLCTSHFCDSLYLEDFGLSGNEDVFISVVDENVGLDEHEEIELQLFPNPAISQLTIVTDHLAQFDRLMISDNSGRIVSDFALPTIYDNRYTVDLSPLESGMYSVFLYGENIAARKSFIIAQ